MALLEAQKIEKHFGSTKVLQDISFSLDEGQALAIIGSSGSGKTTLLRCLNFLETPDAGVISVGGKVIFDAADPATQQESELREKRLHFGLVFQNFNLFPQYTALENVTLAVKLRTPDKSQWGTIDARGRELLAQMGLQDRAGHYPHQLSGGQQQRVSIARALVKDAGVLLFDDSFSALDVKTDAALRRALREQGVRPAKLIVAQRVSTILDADLILVLDEGRLVGAGTHGELLETCPVYRAIADSQMQREGA